MGPRSKQTISASAVIGKRVRAQQIHASPDVMAWRPTGADASFGAGLWSSLTIRDESRTAFSVALAWLSSGECTAKFSSSELWPLL
jgi:hypothetical protein